MGALAGNLAALLAAQQGVHHTRVEIERGNWPGAILILAFATPVMCLLAKSLVGILVASLTRKTA